MVSVDVKVSDRQTIEEVLQLITSNDLERDYLNSVSFLLGHKLAKRLRVIGRTEYFE